MTEKLIKMVNEIAANIDPTGGAETAATRTAEHLTRFWALRMRQDIIAYLDCGGEQLTPVARLAIEKLTERMTTQ